MEGMRQAAVGPIDEPAKAHGWTLWFGALCRTKDRKQ